MKTILSNEYLIWIEKHSDNEVYHELSNSKYNWNNFEISDSVFIETELFEYEYTVEYIDHERQLIILV